MAHITADNKISIFPIEVTIEADGGPYKANAYKMNDTGMILEVFVSTFNPQQAVKLKWILPVDNIAMEEDAVVVKKYTQPKNGKIQYLMEVHFKKLKLSHSQAIKSLLDRYEQQLKKQAEKKKSS